MSKERAFGSGMSQEKATKYVIIGIIIAVAFGTLILISATLANSANITNWATYQNAINQDNLDKGVYGFTEWQSRNLEIVRDTQWMAAQVIYFGPIGRIGLSIGLILVIAGFLGFATNAQMEEHTRRVCITIAAIVAILLFINFIGQLTFQIT